METAIAQVVGVEDISGHQRNALRLEGNIPEGARDFGLDGQSAVGCSLWTRIGVLEAVRLAQATLSFPGRAPRLRPRLREQVLGMDIPRPAVGRVTCETWPEPCQMVFQDIPEDVPSLNTTAPVRFPANRGLKLTVTVHEAPWA